MALMPTRKSLFARSLALVFLVLAASPVTTASTTTSSSSSASASGVSATASTAAASTASPTVYNSSTTTDASSAVRQYAYHGCLLEITGTKGTAPGSRSLQDGTVQILPGNMTVPVCLAFCATAAAATNSTAAAYSYAGLEYGRECWCGQYLSALATEEPAADCDLPCDGDASMLCGGNLRLNVRR